MQFVLTNSIEVLQELRFTHTDHFHDEMFHGGFQPQDDGIRKAGRTLTTQASSHRRYLFFLPTQSKDVTISCNVLLLDTVLFLDL